jgi:tRNA(Ile2) C34 agmatinyltransferase TiaS
MLDKCPDCGKPRLHPERSSGYAGFRCGYCGEWFYADEISHPKKPNKHERKNAERLRERLGEV